MCMYLYIKLINSLILYDSKKTMDYFAEINRIANIAEKYWTCYKYEIAFAVIMVDAGIRKSFLFECSDAYLIPFFINKINFESEKKYDFVVENNFISKTKIKTDINPREIIECVHPNWLSDKRQNCRTNVKLIGTFENDYFYIESAANTPYYKSKLEEKLKCFTEFIESINLKSRAVFEIVETDNNFYIHRKLIAMFETPSILKNEIMGCIHDNKLKIINFLASRGHFGGYIEQEWIPDQENKNEYAREFASKFDNFDIGFWKKLLFEYDLFSVTP